MLDPFSILPLMKEAFHWSFNSQRVYLTRFLYVICPPSSSGMVKIVSTTQTDVIWSTSVLLEQLYNFISSIERIFENEDELLIRINDIECYVKPENGSLVGQFFVPTGFFGALTMDKVVFERSMASEARLKLDAYRRFENRRNQNG